MMHQGTTSLWGADSLLPVSRGPLSPSPLTYSIHVNGAWPDCVMEWQPAFESYSLKSYELPSGELGVF